MPLPQIGIQGMVQKYEFMFLRRIHENGFEPFELLAYDPLFLVVHTRVEDNKERISRDKRIIQLVPGEVHFLLICFLAQRHLRVRVVIAHGQKIGYGYRLRHLPELGPFLFVAGGRDHIARIDDEIGLPFHRNGNKLPIDIITRAVIAHNDECELTLNAFEKDQLLGYLLVLGGK